MEERLPKELDFRFEAENAMKLDALMNQRDSKVEAHLVLIRF